MAANITYTVAESPADLADILALQAINLPGEISREEALEQGFVSIQHEPALLSAMNAPHPHVIARGANGELAGYTLVMECRFRDKIPLLVPFFALLDGLHWGGRPLSDWRYFVMGQVCVAKGFRGQGVFAGLYQHLRRCMAPHYDLIITEISSRNTRSLRAHAKVGFETLHTYATSDGEEWVVVLLPCKEA
jgi:GNAT superfamily N-acetyltransferase